MKRLLLILSALALLAGCGGSGGSDELTVSLAEQSGSTQSGDAVLTRVDDSTTRVEISLGSGAGSDTPQPAHIHKGTCENLNPQPEYPLHDVDAGESSTDVKVSLDELRDGEFAINVHKSAGAIQVYVACGNIASGAAGTDTGEDSGDSGPYGY